MTQLIEAAREGDREAVRDLFDAYYPRVMGFCLKSAAGDRELALDLTQEVFERVFANLQALENPARFQGWLFVIASNVCKRHGNKTSRQQEMMRRLELEMDIELPQSDKRERERRIALVHQLLTQISDQTLRSIVLLKYTEPEHTTRQIADKLQIPHGTVTVKLSRFRAAIKRDLARILLEEEETN